MSNTSLSIQQLVKSKSHFTPRAGKNTTLDNYINFIKTFPKEGPNQHKRYNTSKGEGQALQQLRCKVDIVIKEADKGGAMVVMGKDFYKDNMDKMLYDTSTYTECDKRAEDTTMRKVKVHMTKYKNDVYDDEINYVTNFESKTSQFYGLPKVHKSKTIIHEIVKQNSKCVHICQTN